MTLFLALGAGMSFAESNPLPPGEKYTGEQLVKTYYADIEDLELVYIFKNSKEYFNRFSTFYTHWLNRLKELDFSELDQQDQVDYILLKRNILAELQQLKQRKSDWEKIKYAVPFASKIIRLQQKRRRGNTLEGEKVAGILHEVQRDVEQTKSAVKERAFENEKERKTAINTVKELRKGLKNVYDFYNGYAPNFTYWMKKTYPKTDSVLKAYAGWLNEQPVTIPKKAEDGSGIKGNPIGEKAIKRRLKSQMIPYSPEELIKIAKKEYAWSEHEMIKASKELGYGKDWKQALEAVKKDHLKPGKQPEMIQKMEGKAIRFIDSLHLVTIPDLAKEVWRMDMLTPEQMEFASYFLGGPKILIAYPHSSQDYETKEMIMRSGNHGFANAEVFHELIPGHNLQFFMNKRYRSYRRHFSTPFSVEGWAYYWEMLLWDKGYHQTPEEKIGALYWRMTRSARIVFSLNYHLGKWTPQECIDYLVEKGGLERFSAESEVRRSFTGGYGPLYQIAYMLGGIQLYNLHHEMVEKGRMSNREFNDAFLKNGTIPIEMFRALITNQNLNQNFSTQWKFVGDL